MTPRSRLLVGFLTLAGLAAVTVAVAPDAAMKFVGRNDRAVGEAPIARAADGAVVSARKVAVAAPAMSRHPFPEVPQSRAGLPLEGDPQIATSKEEQAWLDRHGYPNAKQWEALSTASNGQLQSAADSGDRVARAFLNHRRLMAGDRSVIPDMIRDGAAGSLFSLEMLSSYLASQPGNDRIAGYSISRVVEMRGNLRIATARDAMFQRPLTPAERMLGEKGAFQMYNQLLSLQRTIGGISSPAVDPRPVHGG